MWVPGHCDIHGNKETDALPICQKSHLPRSELRILVGLKTGHIPLNKNIHNMGLIDEPICIACGMKGEGH
jgi:hypothetical protein